MWSLGREGDEARNRNRQDGEKRMEGRAGSRWANGGSGKVSACLQAVVHKHRRSYGRANVERLPIEGETGSSPAI